MCDDNVCVALRIRPMAADEKDQICLHVVSGEPKVQIMNTNKIFTYNYVFPPDVGHEEFYNNAVKGLIENIFLCYNVTIFAYGQTDSGKSDCTGFGKSDGVAPRLLKNIFERINFERIYDENHIYEIKITFIELYLDNFCDLLNTSRNKLYLKDGNNMVNKLKYR
ncbi:Chromosome-associated kinesin KIF4 [Formica fusca]